MVSTQHTPHPDSPNRCIENTEVGQGCSRAAASKHLLDRGHVETRFERVHGHREADSNLHMARSLSRAACGATQDAEQDCGHEREGELREIWGDAAKNDNQGLRGRRACGKN